MKRSRTDHTMEIHRITLDSAPLGLGRPVASIGNFDGLHRGHQAVVGELRRRARARAVPGVVVTFEPHPVKVLHPEARFDCLKTLGQRADRLGALGVDTLVLVRFDERLIATTAEDFVKIILVRVLGVSEILVGREFRFGHRRGGSLGLLAELGAGLGFVAHGIDPVLEGGAPISSTRIRACLTEGRVEEAARLLGEPFSIEGQIVRGAGRGRPLVLPTANLETVNECLPAPGVYGTRARLGGRWWRGATFVGVPRTFGETRSVIETHIPTWPGEELYGEPMELAFDTRIRDAMDFASVDALRSQIERDLEAVRRLPPVE